MLFGTAQFALFLAALLLMLRVLPRRAWNGTLLGASLLFYTLWIPAYLPLLLLDIGVNYALLKRMLAAAPGSRARRGLLGCSVVFSLALLLYFKYAVFLLENALPLLSTLGAAGLEAPEILLPLGISFYTFQIISLSVDSYRRESDALPVGGIGRYGLYIAFFPQLIAGPILRGSQLLPQLAAGAQPNPERRRRGIWLLASGVAKKIVLADFLLAPLVDSVFASPGVGNSYFHWVAVYAFAFQIYFDFSGYTDMARGIACWIGFELPENFLEPYLSRDPSEFWRRWHITLSSWLRDYLYIPLGGSRAGSARTYTNLLSTMLLGGLWHGAAWNFVIWGGIHGAMLMLHRALGGRTDPETPLGLRDAPRIFLWFNLVTLAWVFFRAPTLPDAWLFLEGMFGAGEGTGWPVLQTGIVLACLGLHVVERVVRERQPELRAALTRPFWGPALQGAVLGSVVGLAIAVAGASGEFIYFQF